MPPLLPVSTLETSACSSLSRLLAQAFSRLEANERRTRRQKAGGQEDEKEIEEILDCLPAPVLEITTEKVLELLNNKVTPQTGCSGGWYSSRVRGGITRLSTALRLISSKTSNFFIFPFCLQVVAKAGDVNF